MGRGSQRQPKLSHISKPKPTPACHGDGDDGQCQDDDVYGDYDDHFIIIKMMVINCTDCHIALVLNEDSIIILSGDGDVDDEEGGGNIFFLELSFKPLFVDHHLNLVKIHRQ